METENTLPTSEENQQIDAFVQSLSPQDLNIFVDYIQIPNELTPELQNTILDYRKKYGVDRWRRVLFAVDELRTQLDWDYSRLQPELRKRLSDVIGSN